MKRKSSSSCGVTQKTARSNKEKKTCPKQKASPPQDQDKHEKERAAAKPWNQGHKHSKTAKQHVFIPREQLQLFFAVAQFFAGPIYCVVLWLALVTSRRISETLLLRGTDIRLTGGEDHDAPHVLFQKRQEDKKLRGQGKLGAESLSARISESSIEGLKELIETGLKWECPMTLEPFKSSHPKVFENVKPLRKDDFMLDVTSETFLFQSDSRKKKCRPNMARQSVSDAVTRIRDVMWALTHQRRWNPSNQYRGSRVTVHGATRHTSSALLLFNKDKPSMQRPTETTILEVQQRADARTWRKHYCHAHDDEVKEALEFGSAPSPFKRSKKEEKTEKTSKEKSQHGGLTPAKGTESEPNCTSNIPPKGEENTNFERADTSSLAPGPEPRPTSSAEAGSARSGSVQDQESQCQPKQHAFRSRNVAE